MRLPILISLFALTIGCQQAPSPAAVEQEAEAPGIVAVNANAETTLKVEGMMCEVGCVGTIEKALSATTGVSECLVDFENATASVQFDSTQVATQDIVDVINGLADGHYSATIL